MLLLYLYSYWLVKFEKDGALLLTWFHNSYRQTQYKPLAAQGDLVLKISAFGFIQKLSQNSP